MAPSSFLLLAHAASPSSASPSRRKVQAPLFPPLTGVQQQLHLPPRPLFHGEKALFFSHGCAPSSLFPWNSSAGSQHPSPAWLLPSHDAPVLLSNSAPSLLLCHWCTAPSLCPPCAQPFSLQRPHFFHGKPAGSPPPISSNGEPLHGRRPA
jgi:hypothetical protein